MLGLSRPLSFALAAVLCAGASVVVSRVEGQDDDSEKASKKSLDAMEKKKAALFAKKLYDETGYVRAKRPGPGEWLYRFKESGQDAADYQKECANKKREGRAKIYVTELGPLGKRAANVLEPVRAFTKAFFQLDVVHREPEKLPEGYYKKSRRQWDGDRALDLMKTSLPEDALASVGLLDVDIFTEGLNFIFGQGSLSQRVGVYSFVRLKAGAESDEPLYRKRCFRLVGHEIGHILGLEHCIYYECVMNGANSLEEDDTKPLHLCPVCHAKLAWNVGFDDLAREKELAKLLAAEKIEDEAKWSEARVARLEKAK